MRDLLNQMMACIQAGTYHPALITAMVIPDICAALDSDTGFTTDNAMRDWFNAYAKPLFYVKIDGNTAYYLRNGVVHQGRLQHPAIKKTYESIIFIEPFSGMYHLATHQVSPQAGTVLIVDLKQYCQSIKDAALLWLSKVEHTDLYKKNYEQFFKSKQGGVAPHIVGVNVITSI
jgi:hypothetical protein